MAIHFRGWTNQICRHGVWCWKNDSWLLCDFSWGSSPQVAEYPYLGVTLTTSLSWVPHIRKLISRGHRLFAQCVSWCSSERLPVQFASHLFLTYVLPSVSWGCEFCLGSAPAMRLLDGALRRWGRCLLGWPRGSPNAAVHVEVGWPDAQRLVTGRLLSLYGRLSSLPMGDHSPLPELVFRVMSVSPNSMSAVCNALCVPYRSPRQPVSALVLGALPAESGSGLPSVWSLLWTEHSMTGCLPQLPPSPSIMWISGRSR